MKQIMTSIQDVSFQLMQSPRELASWNFPLSQILEAYFNLLPEPCKIHYGEAALVIQNSVNAYIRRLEDLYGETTGLCQKLVTELNANTKKSFLQDKKYNKKGFNFSQFEVIDFNQVTGKNINLKNSRDKSIKFLHHNFCQLENSAARFQIQMLDIHGDVIGKKYDFRCNQKMTNTGILIDELIPKDFILDFVQEDLQAETIVEKSFFIEDVTTINAANRTETVNALPIKNNNSAIMENNMSVDNCRNSYNVCSGYFSTLNELEEETFIFSAESHEGIQESSSTHYKNNENFNICGKNVSNNEIYNSKNMGPPTDLVSRETADQTIKKNKIIYSKLQEIKADVRMENSLVECKDRNRKIDNNYFDNISNLSDDPKFLLRRSKRFPIVNESVESRILKSVATLKSIPFKDGIPKKVISSRKEFRLPCPINLLKFRLTGRNRKILRKQTKMSSCSSTETTENLKTTLYSPSRQQTSIMKEEDQNEFSRNFDETFKIRQTFVINYKPVTTFTMDLLGFHPNYNDEGSELIYDGGATSLLSESNSLSSQYVISPPSSPRHFAPTMSPSHLNVCATAKKNKYRTRNFHNRKSKRYFENVIKNKIKKIYEELDLHTDEDQKVARWHAEIRPILKEAERKPPFEIHEYGSRILRKLQNGQRKVHFDEIVLEEPPSEVARYFSAILQLASTNDLNISTKKDSHKSIELLLLN